MSVQAESEPMSVDEQVSTDSLVHTVRALTAPPVEGEHPAAPNGRMFGVVVEGRMERISEEHLSYMLRRRELFKELENATNGVKFALRRALENARAPLRSTTDAGLSCSRAEARSFSMLSFRKSRTSSCSGRSVTAIRPPKPAASISPIRLPKVIEFVTVNGSLKIVEPATVDTNRSPRLLESASVSRPGPSASLSASSNVTSSNNTPPLSSGSSARSTSVSKVSPPTSPDDDNNGPIVCGINGCKCTLPRTFLKVRDHIRYHHRHALEMEIPSTLDEFQCPYPKCHFKSPHRMRVAEHCCSSQHLDVPPRCYACGKSFNGRLYALTRHLQEACKKGGRWEGRIKRDAKVERTESDIPLIDVVKGIQQKRKAEEDQEAWKSKKACEEKLADEDTMDF